MLQWLTATTTTTTTTAKQNLKKLKFTAILILLLTNQLQVYVRIFDLPETLKKNYLSDKKSLEVSE